MKAQCEKEAFQHAVLLVERATGKNLPLAVLSSILISAEKNKLVIRATDLDLGIEVVVPAKVEKEGVLAISGTVLGQFLQGGSQSDTVTITQEGEAVTFNTSSNNATIATTPHEDFPTLPKVSDGLTITLPASDLAAGLRSVSYSASQSTIKPELNSVYVHAKEKGVLTCVATDSFRLAEKTLNISKLEPFDPILIPVKNIPEILRVLETSEDDVEVCITQNQFALSFKHTYVTSRLVEGTFPDYEQIIPKESKTEAVVLKQDVIGALKTANVFLGKFSQITLSASPGEKVFTLQTKNSEIGENITRLNATLTGEDIALSFNHRYIFDCFQSINTDSVVFSFSGPGKPVIIRGVGDRSFLYLVMPMSA